MRYLDFDIEIGEGLGRSYPVVVRSAAGDAHVTMQFPFDDGALENLLLKLRNVQHKALPEVKQAVQDFGRQLFEALLPDEARSLFYACHNRAIQERLPGIRIRLHIQEPKLATLPWEYLYDFSSGGYLCLLRSSPVVRRLELPLSTIPLKIKLPLRILGMFASPSDQRTLDIGREQTRMERAVMDLMASGQIELTWLEGQTWEDLQKALQSGHWHIFHFMGHAGFDSFTKEGLIALSDRNGKTHLLSASELALLLKNNGSIRLAGATSLLAGLPRSAPPARKAPPTHCS